MVQSEGPGGRDRSTGRFPTGTGRDGETEVEILDTGSMPGRTWAPEPRLHPGSGSSGLEPDLDEDGETAAVVTGRATVGGRQGLIRTLVGAGSAVLTVIALLFWLDRAAPEAPPEQAGDPTPSGLVTTTTIPVAPAHSVITVPPTVAPTTLPPNEYLLGRPTGLWLFSGGDEPLMRLDLDNGAVVDFGVRVVPAAVTGEQLVLYQREAGMVGLIPVDPPGTQAVWKQGYAALGEEPGQLWTLGTDAAADHPAGVDVGFGRWELLDATSSRILERRPGDLYEQLEARRQARDLLPAWAGALRPGPDLTVRPDGLASYSETGYVSLVSGAVTVLVYDERRALIDFCDGEACEVRWIDRGSGAVDASTPLPELDVVGARFAGGGRWLLVVSGTGASELVELDGTRRMRFEIGENPALSPDGQWLAVRSQGVVVIVDMATGEEVTTFGETRADGPPGDLVDNLAAGLLFVEKPSDDEGGG